MNRITLAGMRGRRLGLALLSLTILAACDSAPELNAQSRVVAGEREAIRFTTELGEFTAILYPEAAPETVARYQEYADTDYYVGRGFGRVVPGFVIQLTDQLLGLTEDDRTLPLEPSGAHFFSAGALGIARASSPNSGGPEFFVMDFASGHLHGDYTVFGQVIEGMDTVRKIARVPAVDWRESTGLDPLLFDRYAIDAVQITAATRVTVVLGEAQAARYPLRTAERVRGERYAHNLEWPASVAVGAATDMIWYLTVLDGESALPEPAELMVVTPENLLLPVQGDPDTAGIYSFVWTPQAIGRHGLSLQRAGQVLATLEVRVAR